MVDCSDHSVTSNVEPQEKDCQHRLLMLRIHCNNYSGSNIVFAEKNASVSL